MILSFHRLSFCLLRSASYYYRHYHAIRARHPESFATRCLHENDLNTILAIGGQVEPIPRLCYTHLSERAFRPVSGAEPANYRKREFGLANLPLTWKRRMARLVRRPVQC